MVIYWSHRIDSVAIRDLGGLMKTRAWPDWILVGFFGLFFAYDIWEGIGNFIGVQYTRLTFGFELTLLGWLAIFAGILIPLALFLIGIVVTRGMSLPQTIFVFVLLLVVSSVVGADLTLGLNEALLYSVNTP